MDNKRIKHNTLISQMSSSLTDLISSKTRIKILLKLFLNPMVSGYLRGLATEFDDSTNSVRTELNRLMGAGMLTSVKDGNKLLYKANEAYPLYGEIQSIVKKHLGIDQLIKNVVERLGDVEQVYLTGAFSEGKNSNVIDLLLIGQVELDYLTQLIEKTEKLIDRKIRYVHYESSDWSAELLEQFDGLPMLIWQKGIRI